MADVSPPPVPGSDASRGGPRDSDRGQLFLVGALALSVILVTLAVLLNTAIYTGNIATRDPGTGSADVIEYRASAAEMAGRTLTGVNYRNNESYDALESNFSDSVGNWSVAATMHSVVKGTDAHANATNITRGTRIVQHGDRNFTNASGVSNWLLAEDVQVRNYTMTVDQSTLPTVSPDDAASDFSDTFHVSITDSNGHEWRVYVYLDDTGDATLAVVDETDSTLEGSCPSSTTDPTVNLTNGSFDGSDCVPLSFWGDADAPYDVTYRHTETTNGTYSLVVDKDTDTLDTTDFNADGAGASPYVTPALYSAEVEVTYRSPTVNYSTIIRVAPGEYDA